MRISLAQMAAASDKSQNLDTIRRVASEAKERGSKMLVLPEGAMVHFDDANHRLVDAAEPLDGTFVSGLRDVAASTGLAVVGGVFEPYDSVRVYNTVVAIDGQGDVIGSYRKIHLYDAFGYSESSKIKAGDGEALTFQLGSMTFGVMTCYDLRFPELGRQLVDEGADAIVLPAGWVNGLLKEAHWEVLLRARAIENTAYVLAADQVGGIYIGSSMVVDPLGVVRARAGEGEELLTCDVTTQRVKAARETLPSLAHRRFTVRFVDHPLGEAVVAQEVDVSVGDALGITSIR